MPVKAPPVVAAAVYNWTGFYIGGHVGYGSGTKQWTDPLGPPFDAGSHTVTGGLGGAQLGANYQTGRWVFGIEGQYSWADLNGSHFNPLDLADRLTTRVRWTASVAGRIGHAFDRTLIYVRGGIAWIRDEHTKIDLGILEAAGNITRTGWLVGAGVEQAFWANWSGRIEYNYMDFGRSRVALFPIAGGAPDLFDVRQDVHTVTIGLNYRFGASVVTARY